MTELIQSLIPQYGELNRIYSDLAGKYAFSFEKQKKVTSAVVWISPFIEMVASINTNVRFTSLTLALISIMSLSFIGTGFLYLTLRFVVMPDN